MTTAVGFAPDASPALVLNADFRPLSYFPLSVWSWQETIKAVFLGRVNVITQCDLAQKICTDGTLARVHQI